MVYIKIFVFTMRRRCVIFLFMILIVLPFPNIPIPMLCVNKYFVSAFLVPLIFRYFNPKKHNQPTNTTFEIETEDLFAAVKNKK